MLIIITSLLLVGLAMPYLVWAALTYEYGAIILGESRLWVLAIEVVFFLFCVAFGLVNIAIWINKHTNGG